MAVIKIPYEYEAYPNNPYATELSQKLARRRAKKTGVLFGMVGFFVGMLLPAFIFGPKLNGFIFLLGCAIGIFAGVYLNGLINKKLEKELEECLKLLEAANQNSSDR